MDDFRLMHLLLRSITKEERDSKLRIVNNALRRQRECHPVANRHAQPIHRYFHCRNARRTGGYARPEADSAGLLPDYGSRSYSQRHHDDRSDHQDNREASRGIHSKIQS